MRLSINIQLDNDDKAYERRVLSKVLKFDKNNQYGFVMTKPMPVGSIQEKEDDFREFNLLFEKKSL